MDKLCVVFFVLGKLEVLQYSFSGRPVKRCELIQFMLRMSYVCILKPTYSHFVCLGRSWFDGFHWAERCWKATYGMLHIIYIYTYEY